MPLLGGFAGSAEAGQEAIERPLCGAVISHGLGYPAVPLAGAAMSAIGLVMVLMARRSAKEEASRPKIAVMGH